MLTFGNLTIASWLIDLLTLSIASLSSGVKYILSSDFLVSECRCLFFPIATSSDLNIAVSSSEALRTDEIPR